MIGYHQREAQFHLILLYLLYLLSKPNEKAAWDELQWSGHRSSCMTITTLLSWRCWPCNTSIKAPKSWSFLLRVTCLRLTTIWSQVAFKLFKRSLCCPGLSKSFMGSFPTISQSLAAAGNPTCSSWHRCSLRPWLLLGSNQNPKPQLLGSCSFPILVLPSQT